MSVDLWTALIDRARWTAGRDLCDMADAPARALGSRLAGAERHRDDLDLGIGGFRVEKLAHKLSERSLGRGGDRT